MKLSTKLLLGAMTAFMLNQNVLAKEVNVDITVQELEIEIDNKGTKQMMWTFGGTIPGPVVRVKQGDTVNFNLINLKSNKQSHSMDFHAAQVDVLDEFSEIKPGKSKNYTFKANYPGVFIYHCGASAMSEHIARGMYGVIIVDPKDGYTEDYPKPDREYVIVEGDLFEAGTKPNDITMGKGWKASLINGKVFHYDPVHDSDASLTLESKPGERVRIFFVNANINESVAFHPIAGIWDRVYDNGNPKNIKYGMQTVDVAPAHGMVFDLISPKGKDTNNALVNHRMKRALNGAITVLMNHEDYDGKKGQDGNLVLREE
ncbi:MAG: multicopper oxidase domain-containing protein [Campylobacteraceae bacterium]|nr:multicopper oxidase domain-containing protein [Campylobacteraceae bacterium]